MKVIRYRAKSRIGKPGVYSGLPIDAYHGDICTGPSVSKSGLHTLLGKSPAHFWDTCPWNPDRAPETKSTALDFGNAAHMLLLGEKHFAEKYALKMYDEFRTKEARAWRDAQIDAGKRIISSTEIDRIRRMRDALADHPLVQQGVLNGKVEHTLIAKLANNVFLKSRPDVIPVDSGFYADLKTTSTIDYSDLERNIYNFGYHMQAAVMRMCAIHLGLPFEEFVFIFVEKERPHIVRPMVLKADAIDTGQKQALLALAIFKECIKRGQWPGPQGFEPEPEFISIPGWAESRADTQAAIMEKLLS